MIRNKLQSSSSSHSMITIRVFFDGPTSSSKSTSLSLLFSSTPISFNIISLYFGFCTHWSPQHGFYLEVSSGSGSRSIAHAVLKIHRDVTTIKVDVRLATLKQNHLTTLIKIMEYLESDDGKNWSYLASDSRGFRKLSRMPGKESCHPWIPLFEDYIDVHFHYDLSGFRVQIVENVCIWPINAFSLSISESVNRFTSSLEYEIFASERKLTLQNLTCADLRNI